MLKVSKKFSRLIALVIAAAACFCLFAACGKPSGNNETPAPEKVSDVNEIYAKLKESGLLPELTPVPERDLFEVYGIDSSKLKQWVFTMSENYSLDAGEVVIFEVNDPEYMTELAKKVQNHLDRIKAVSKDYSPEQASKLEKVEVKSVGNYVYMVVGENYESLMKIMKDCLG